jgi:NTP pyrophosphatase (non-canonical NTP hydrolase)
MNLSDYQNRIEDTWIKNVHDKERILLGIFGETGEIAELLKKKYRGDVIDNFLIKLRKEIGDVFYYLCKLCNYYGFSAENILQENIDKLKDRKNRGVLKGNGDDR